MSDDVKINAEDLDELDDSTSEGQWKLWNIELAAARKELKEYHEKGRKIVKRFLDERKSGGNRDSAGNPNYKLNLYTANTQTMQSLLFGKLPQVDTTRRFQDANDALSRIAGEMLQRILNTDIEKDNDTFAGSLAHSLFDYLVPGGGWLRNRYVAELEEQDEVPAQLHPETGEELAPAYTPDPIKVSEGVETDYIHWDKVLWSPCKVYSELRWVAFDTPMSKKSFKKRFGADITKLVNFSNKDEDREEGQDKNDPWNRVSVWEIWDKESKQVFWWTKGYSKVLDVKPDPLGLDNFWPWPRPMFSNLSTDKFMPVSDFHLAADLYDEIDDVSERIGILEDAIAVRGVYDETNEGVVRLLTEAARNDLIPIKDWNKFSEKGGISKAVDWLPLEMIVMALDKLREYRTELMGLLYQVTGMSDIMRGQASGQSTATEQAIKARFASVRVQTKQDEVARFASEAQRIKAEIISKHFDIATIIKRSNIESTPDAAQAMQAAQVIKDKFWQYRIAVKPEAISLQDFTALRQERTEFIQGLATFFQGAMPIAQQLPQGVPYLLELLKWAMAGFKGSSTIEGVLDRALAVAAQEAAQPKPQQPDPKLEAAKVKAGAEKEKAHVETQKVGLDLQAAKAKHQMEMQKIAMQAAATQQGSEAKMREAAVAQVTGITEPGAAPYGKNGV
jgi:hypothetical protein